MFSNSLSLVCFALFVVKGKISTNESEEENMNTRYALIVSFAALTMAGVNTQADEAKTEVAQKAKATHQAHNQHKHKHGEKNCAHKAEKHGDHTDYEDEGHHHKKHGSHYDECGGPEADAKKGDAKTEAKSE
jgi:ABC-type nickel/cobalt efflux system permease component RcnA